MTHGQRLTLAHFTLVVQREQLLVLCRVFTTCGNNAVIQDHVTRAGTVSGQVDQV